VGGVDCGLEICGWRIAGNIFRRSEEFLGTFLKIRAHVWGGIPTF